MDPKLTNLKIDIGGSASQRRIFAIIGSELVLFEASVQRIGIKTPLALKDLREGLAFVSTEYLSSYLDDLLDPDVADGSLFIEAGRSNLSSKIVAILGVVLSISCGLGFAVWGIGFSFALIVTILFSAPFVCFLFQAFQSKIARRLALARALSAVINQRGRSTGGGLGEIFSFPRQQFFSGRAAA
jgi:hypothetical protein